MTAEEFLQAFREALIGDDEYCLEWKQTKSSTRRSHWRTKCLVYGNHKFRIYYTALWFNSLRFQLDWSFGRIPTTDTYEIMNLRVYNGPNSTYCIGEMAIRANGEFVWKKEIDSLTWMKIRLAG
jgi:hypothetical protein